MSNIPNFTEENIQNLIILRDFMRDHVDVAEFDMGLYCGLKSEDGEEIVEEVSLEELDSYEREEYEVNCGTSMCMLGWGSAIREFDATLKGVQAADGSWGDFGKELYGVNDSIFNLDDGVNIGPYLFSPTWSEVPQLNTVEFAVQRINSVLKAIETNRLRDIGLAWDALTADLEKMEHDDIDPDYYLV